MAIEELEAAALSLTIGIDAELGLRNPRRRKPLIYAGELPLSFTDTAKTAESCTGSARATVSTGTLAGGTREIDPGTIAPGLKASKASATDKPSKCFFLASLPFRNGLESDSTGGEDKRNLFPNSAALEKEGTGGVPSDLVGATRGAEEKPKTTGEIPSNLEEATRGKENPATGDADPEDADPKVIESSEENEDFFETTSGVETTEGMEEECSTNAGKVAVETPTAFGAGQPKSGAETHPETDSGAETAALLAKGLSTLVPSRNRDPLIAALHLLSIRPATKPNLRLSPTEDLKPILFEDPQAQIKALDRRPRISRICPNTPDTLSFCSEVSPSTTATPYTQAEQLTQTLELRHSLTRSSLPRGSGACFSMAEQSTGGCFFKSHHPATD
jgi:hypothetical protein